MIYEINKITEEAINCKLCLPHLVDGVNPVFVIHPKAKILIIGQAPGRKVHESGKPWADASGKRLMNWLGISPEEFYDPSLCSILPMGFCFPGSKKSGDLAPRPECAPLWHKPMINMMPDIELTLLIGKYAQNYYLDIDKKQTLTETVRNWRSHSPKYIPMPHPSPRNNIWLRKNPWFEKEVIFFIQKAVRKMIK